MPGLLDKLNEVMMSPQGGLAVGLLNAAGPSRTPVSLGQAFAQGSEIASQRQQDALRNQILRERLADMQRERQMQQQQQDALGELFGSLGPQTPADGVGPESPGLLTPVQSKILQTMGRFNPQAALQSTLGLLEPPEQSSFEQKLGVVEQHIGRNLSSDEVLGLAGGGTTINIGDNKAAEPIPVSELRSIRMPDGSTPPLGMTYGRAGEAGAKVFSASELDEQRQVDTALGVMADLRELAVGDNGVFTDVPANALGRAAVGIANGIGGLFGTEGSVRRSVYSDLSRGTIAPLVRTLGEAGALSDADREAALGLLPETGSLPTSGREAEQKLRQLQRIFERASQNLGMDERRPPSNGVGGAGGAEFDFDPTTGQLVPRR